MTFTKFVGISLLMLPLLSHAVPFELEAEAGRYRSCGIKTPSADNAVTGSIQLLATSPHPQWTPMIAVSLMDAAGKPIYRFGVMAGDEAGQYVAFQGFVSSNEESATEFLGPVRAGDAAPIQLKWNDRGWVLSGVADSGWRTLSLSRKPASAVLIVSGATARLDLHDPATPDCDVHPLVEPDLVGSWNGTDSTGAKALLRLDADGHASLTMDGKTWGGPGQSGASMRYRIDHGKSPMWLDFVAVGADGKEYKRLLWTIERINATSLRVRAGAKPDKRPDPADPASTKFTATFEKSSEP